MKAWPLLLNRWFSLTLRISQRGPTAAFFMAHLISEISEIIGNAHPCQLHLHRVGQIIVVGMHIEKFSVPSSSSSKQGTSIP
jgi:hypothetical protein